MEFNFNFVHRVSNVFRSIDCNSPTSQFVKELALENNNIFNRFLVTEISNYEVEIPVIAREHIERIVSGYIGYLHDKKTIVLPLYENSEPQEKRTFDTFIGQFFNSVDYNNRLQKITSNKGETYYGGKGLIFDDKFNPLLLCTLKARRIFSKDMYKMLYYKPVIYVNPIVFTESNRLINKGIIKKLIPYYTTNEIHLPRIMDGMFYVDYENLQDSKKALVIVNSPDRFFVKPTVPKPQSCTNESLNECLVNNIDDILSII